MYVSLESLSRLNELARIDLQNLHDRYFTWLLWSTLFVFFGIVLEGIEVVKDLIEVVRDLRPRQRVAFRGSDGMPIARRRSSVKWKVIATIGWIFVFAGVVGEGIFEDMVTSADGLLQTFNETLLQAAQASANRANDRALQLSLDLDSAAARLDAARKNLAIIEKRVAWRDLTDAQVKSLTATLTPFGGQSSYWTRDNSIPDDEIGFFMSRLMSAVPEEWRMRGRLRCCGSGRIFIKGIVIQVTPSRTEATGRAASALFSWLKREHFQVVLNRSALPGWLREINIDPDGVVVVEIGARP